MRAFCTKNRIELRKKAAFFDPDSCSTPRTTEFTRDTEVGNVFTTHYCMFGLLGYFIIGTVVSDAFFNATGERISIRSEPP